MFFEKNTPKFFRGKSSFLIERSRLAMDLSKDSHTENSVIPRVTRMFIGDSDCIRQTRISLWRPECLFGFSAGIQETRVSI